MSIFKIIIGVATTLFFIYFRSAFNLAKKQKIVAIRLRSYLFYWKKLFINSDLFNIYYLGIQWYKEIQDIIKKGGKVQNLIELENQKKKEIEKIRTIIEQGKIEGDIEKHIETLKQIFDRMSYDLISIFVKEIQMLVQNLVEGKLFLSDNDICILDKNIAHLCLNLKMDIISSLNSIEWLVVHLYQDYKNSNNIEVKKFAKQLSDIIWRFMLISKNMEFLINLVDKIVNEKLSILIAKNLCEL